MGNSNPNDWAVHSLNSAPHFHSSSDSEGGGYFYGQRCHGYPGSQNPPSSFPITVQSYDPSRGILTSDYPNQYSPQPDQFFIGSFYPGNPEVGYHFPAPKPVPAQATFLSRGSGAPSGDFMSLLSSCAPPLHLTHPSAPPASLPYDPRRRIFSVPTGRVDIQPQSVSVSMIGPAGHVQTIPVRRRNRTSATLVNTHPRSSKPKSTVQWYCPVSGCGVSSGRPQERNRHLQSRHLPCWIACSSESCLWRGDRPNIFTKHWCDNHQTTEPDGQWHRLYDPRPLVDGVVNGTISIEDAMRIAIEKVEETALVIHKPEFLEDPSGRKGKKGF
ncbi:hypothetical protein H4582DRAFT_291481 [Lactarius indigo]|nr:hypothetical protein H4582DRAFT_291481 [Lactarius indigo]